MEIPYKGITVGTKSEIVTNPFSGASCLLTPEAVAVYDIIKGCEYTRNYYSMQQGLEWFQNNYPKEYMLLLD
jgi:hypothetical protein